MATILTMGVEVGVNMGLGARHTNMCGKPAQIGLIFLSNFWRSADRRGHAIGDDITLFHLLSSIMHALRAPL